MDVQCLIGFDEPVAPASFRRWLCEVIGADMVGGETGVPAFIRPGYLKFPQETIRFRSLPGGYRVHGTSSGEPMLWSPEDAFSASANLIRLCSILEGTIVRGFAQYWMVGGELGNIVTPQPWQFLESAAFGRRDLDGIDAVSGGFWGRPSLFIHSDAFWRVFETFSRSDTLEEHRARTDLLNAEGGSTSGALQAILDRRVREFAAIAPQVQARLAEIDKIDHFP